MSFHSSSQFSVEVFPYCTFIYPLTVDKMHSLTHLRKEIKIVRNNHVKINVKKTSGFNLQINSPLGMFFTIIYL